MTDRQTKLLFAVLLLIAIFAWAAYFYVRSLPPEPEVGNNTSSVSYTFPAVELQANSAIVYDLVTGKTLFEKNAEAQLPLASVAKLLLAAALPSSENRTLTITGDDLKPEGDSSLRTGERWRLPDLLDFTLAMSVNDGAYALAGAAAALQNSSEPLLTSSLNAVARDLGLAQTYVIDPTGLDISSSTAGAYGSAKDTAKLMGAVLRRHPASLEATTISAFDAYSLDGKEHEVINTNPLVGTIPGLLVSKTGFTDLAHGNLALAIDVGFFHPVAIVILDSGYTGRFDDAKILIEATRAAFRSATSTSSQ